MASKLIGRVKCGECGFDGAHVKIKTDPAEGKTPLAYRHCPECGAQYFPRSQAQADALVAKMRPEGAPAPTPAKPPQEPAQGSGKPPEQEKGQKPPQDVQAGQGKPKGWKL